MKGNDKPGPDKTSSAAPQVTYRHRCQGWLRSMIHQCVLEDGHTGPHSAVWLDPVTRCRHVLPSGVKCARHEGHAGAHLPDPGV